VIIKKKDVEGQRVGQVGILYPTVCLNGFRTIAAFDQDNHSAGQYLEMGPSRHRAAMTPPTTTTPGTFFISNFAAL
jgi:hypothetical protein